MLCSGCEELVKAPFYEELEEMRVAGFRRWQKEIKSLFVFAIAAEVASGGEGGREWLSATARLRSGGGVAVGSVLPTVGTVRQVCVVLMLGW